MNYTQEEYEEMKLKIKISKNWSKDYIHEVVETALEKGRPICGAKTRAGTPCKKNQVIEGRCRIAKHNGSPKKLKGNKNAVGNSGGAAPKGNKNAVTTGEYESIFLDTLDEGEKDLYLSIKTDVINQLDEEIRLTTIRERRMMKRIQELKQSEFTVVERKSKDGFGPEGPIDTNEEKELATLGQIQSIEDALTRVQGRKARLINIKHKVENGDNINSNMLVKIIDDVE